MEKLPLEHQLVLKYASVLGDEFSDEFLLAVLPVTFTLNSKNARFFSLQNILEDLLLYGFFICLEDEGIKSDKRKNNCKVKDDIKNKNFNFCQIEKNFNTIYSFQNNFIQLKIKELLPPSDASILHLKIAQYIEHKFQNDLTVYFPILAYHYQRCKNKKHLSFKFELKSADIAISQCAFNDGLNFAIEAFQSVELHTEIQILLKVLDVAIVNINSYKDNIITSDDMKKSYIVNILNKYKDLKILVEFKLEDLQQVENARKETRRRRRVWKMQYK
jgi:hypothetical protein